MYSVCGLRDFVNIIVKCQPFDPHDRSMTVLFGSLNLMSYHSVDLHCLRFLRLKLTTETSCMIIWLASCIFSRLSFRTFLSISTLSKSNSCFASLLLLTCATNSVLVGKC